MKFIFFVIFSLIGFSFHLYASTDDCCCAKKPSRDTAMRLLHAKELIGSKYPRTLVSQSARLPSVKKFVRQVVSQRLGQYGKAYVSKVSKAILKESAKEKLDPLFVLAVIETESEFDPHIIGNHGEIGLMQVKPDTAQWIAEKNGIKWKGSASLKDPATNIKIGVTYLAFLREEFEGLAHQYVAAYNMGPGGVRKLASLDIRPKDYSTRVMSNYYGLYQNLLDQGH